MFLAHFRRDGRCVWRSPAEHAARITPGQLAWEPFDDATSINVRRCFFHCLRSHNPQRVEAHLRDHDLIYLGSFYYVGCPLVAETSAGVCVPDTFAKLTPRERDVLGALSVGGNLKAVPRQLGISRGTVATHVYSIERKLGLHDMSDLLRFALRSLPPGWFDAAPHDCHEAGQDN